MSDIPLLPLEDSRWATYRGGYNGILYHAVPIIGEIPPISRAALAAQGKKARVALVCGDNETFAQLLQRLDAALAKVMADGTVIDEVLPEIKRRQSR